MPKNVKMKTILINFFFQENDMYNFLMPYHKDIFILFYRSIIYISSSFPLRCIYVCVRARARVCVFIAIF